MLISGIISFQVKYHSGQTPHPNKFEPSKAFQIMSEAETDDEIIEVNPSDVHYHNAVEKQVGLLVVPPARSPRSLSPKSPRNESKSPSPHLAIISDFIDIRRQKEKAMIDKEKTPIVNATHSGTFDDFFTIISHLQPFREKTR